MVLVLTYDKKTEMCGCMIIETLKHLKIHKKDLYHTIIDAKDKTKSKRI